MLIRKLSGSDIPALAKIDHDSFSADEQYDPS
jgi:hypothetical protein